jgi:dihydropteroate synthase
MKLLDVLNRRGKEVELFQPNVMGIINLTPDSFSDGGSYPTLDAAIRHAVQMVAEGAAIIDVGGESSRPNSIKVSLQEELERVIPVIAKLSREIPVPISIDTTKPEVMREAIAAGASMINDITALRAPGALEIACVTQVPVCLMHMQGEPQSMQKKPYYHDVVVEVCQFLAERTRVCIQAGISPEKIIVDPGFGFGKLVQHNLQLLNQLEKLQALNFPILVGWSRKATIGEILERPVTQRLYGSLACAVLAVAKGARLIRAHDVQPTVDAIKMATAVLKQGLI